MISYTWRIESLFTDESDDGFLYSANVHVYGIQDGVTKLYEFLHNFAGNKAAVGAEFKSIDDLKKADGEAIIIGWIKNTIGTEKVAEIEATLRRRINDHNLVPAKGWISHIDIDWPPLPEETPLPEGYPYQVPDGE